jgi:hypothetical protein
MKHLLYAIAAISLAVGGSAFAKGHMVSESLWTGRLRARRSSPARSQPVSGCMQLSRGYKNPQEWCPKNIGVRRGACP